MLHKVVAELFGCMYAHCGCYQEMKFDSYRDLVGFASKSYNVNQLCRKLQKTCQVTTCNQIVAEKLDKNNFHAWRFRITNFLMGKRLLGVH